MDAGGLMKHWLLLTLAVVGCRESVGPTPDPELSRRLAASEQVACALTSQGSVHCWGFNSAVWEYGAPPDLVAGSMSPAATSLPVMTKLALGVGQHLCGITSENDALCWARGNNGQLGGGAVAGMGNPVATVDGDIEWEDISVGRITTCGLSTEGDGYCWGHNQRGEIGSTTVPLGALTPTPTLVEGGHTFKSVVAGWLHACGITTAGDAYCWGGNTSGQLGMGVFDTTSHRSPELVAGLPSGGLAFAQITLGSRYTCGITMDGDAYCWGENATGQLGDGTQVGRAAPTRVAGGLKFKQIVASSGFANGAFATPPTSLQGAVGHTCALTPAGQAYCWGWNGNGELGDGSNIDRLTPTPVSGGLTFDTIASGGAYTCGMAGDNVWCWGSNTNGQLGKGDLAHASTPQRVLAPFQSP
jgi:alpha-tubulin suppressor-like RCC1 family protein